jgi:hypothetical protein
MKTDGPPWGLDPAGQDGQRLRVTLRSPLGSLDANVIDDHCVDAPMQLRRIRILSRTAWLAILRNS